MKTNELIEAFKSWDGKAWLASHMAWLKGSYQMAQLSPPKLEEETPAITKAKQRPYVNEDKQDSMWKWRVANYGKRQAKKMAKV